MSKNSSVRLCQPLTIDLNWVKYEMHELQIIPHDFKVRRSTTWMPYLHGYFFAIKYKVLTTKNIRNTSQSAWALINILSYGQTECGYRCCSFACCCRHLESPLLLNCRANLLLTCCRHHRCCFFPPWFRKFADITVIVVVVIFSSSYCRCFYFCCLVVVIVVVIYSSPLLLLSLWFSLHHHYRYCCYFIVVVIVVGVVHCNCHHYRCC